MRSPASMGALPPTLLALLATLTTAQHFYGGLLVSTTKKVVPDCTRHSKVGDTLSMHYRGTLQSDGTEFDSSHSRGPFTFKLGAGQVIEGWDKGLVGMCIGEMRNLTIPPGMAYGDRAIGKIPAGSTLVFETELLGIEGVKPESEPIQEPNVPPENKKGPGEHKGGEAGSGHGHKDGPQHDDDGECKLLGPFALLIQGALGLLAIMSLVFKRWREVPRRPLKVWSFDVSKQVFGSVLLHLANLLMSMFSSGDFDITKATTPDATAASTAAAGGFVQDAQQDRPNPCSFYLLNLAIDTTIGIPILVLLLRLLHYFFSLTPLAQPAGSLRSGNYGHPPKASWWLKQSFIYFLGLLGMKLCVFIIFQLLPWLGWVGDWALRWTEGKAWVQVLFVMLIFPLVMNAMQYYIIDSFIKDPAGASDGPQEEDEREEGGENEGLIGGRRHSEDGEEEHGVLREAEAGRLKEANPTPMPVEYDSDDEQTRVGSSGSTAKGIAK